MYMLIFAALFLFFLFNNLYADTQPKKVRILYILGTYPVLLQFTMLGMDKEQFEIKLKKAILNRNISELEVLAENKLFNTKMVEDVCNFPFLYYAVQPPPYTDKIELLVKNFFYTSQTKEEDTEILEQVLSQEKVAETIRFLVQKGVDPSVPSCQSKRSCFHAKGGDRLTPLVCFLLCGEKHWYKTYSEENGQFYKFLYQKIAKTVLDTLLKCGANPNVKYDVGYPGLFTGCHYVIKHIQDPEVTNLLVLYGADLSKQTASGDTCIHMLVQEGRLDICKTLFPLLPTCQDKQCMLTLLLVQKYLKELKLAKPLVFEIMNWTFDEKFLLAKKHQSRTVNELLEMENKAGKTPHIVAQEYYEGLKNKTSHGNKILEGDEEYYTMGPWEVSHEDAVETYKQIIDFVNPDKYK